MNRDFLVGGLLLVGAALVACNNQGTSGETTDTTSSMTGAMGADTTTTAAPYASTAPLRGADSSFAQEAASGGLMEVELGRIAQQKAENPRVRGFGEMMVKDHSAANAELKNLASAKSLALSDSMMKKHRDHIASLEKLSGKNFDKKYMDLMVNDHREDVKKFEQTASSASDTDLKAWAQKTLPVLRTHLDSAQAIKGALK